MIRSNPQPLWDADDLFGVDLSAPIIPRFHSLPIDYDHLPSAVKATHFFNPPTYMSFKIRLVDLANKEAHSDENTALIKFRSPEAIKQRKSNLPLPAYVSSLHGIQASIYCLYSLNAPHHSKERIYLHIKALGMGGYGKVKMVIDLLSGNEYTLKITEPNGFKDLYNENNERYAAKSLKRYVDNFTLSHRNYFSKHALVLHHIDGISLYNYRFTDIASTKKFDRQCQKKILLLLHISKMAVKSVDDLHKHHNLLHNDIKCANFIIGPRVMLNRINIGCSLDDIFNDLKLSLIDFGSSTTIGYDYGLVPTTFASPEIDRAIKAKAVTIPYSTASDAYCIGLIMHTLFNLNTDLFSIPVAEFHPLCSMQFIGIYDLIMSLCKRIPEERCSLEKAQHHLNYLMEQIKILPNTGSTTKPPSPREAWPMPKVSKNTKPRHAEISETTEVQNFSDGVAPLPPALIMSPAYRPTERAPKVFLPPLEVKRNPGKNTKKCSIL